MLPAFIAGISEVIENHLWTAVKGLWRQRSSPEKLQMLAHGGFVAYEIETIPAHAGSADPGRPTRLSATRGVG